MKVLLDTCLSLQARQALLEAGHDVIWGGDWAEDPGDEAILQLAFREERVMVTLDKDFGELAVARRIPHSGILRLVNFPVEQQAAVCLKIFAEHAGDLRAAALITAEPGRVRIRRTK